MRLTPQTVKVELQPKQIILDDLVNNSMSSWIGAGGGRGGAKSAGLHRIMYLRRLNIPGTIGAICMKTWEQIKKYHVDPLLRDFPELVKHYHAVENKIVIPMKDGPPSEIHFRYAETYEDVERVFKSGSYYDIMVDQAEQYSKECLEEMKQAVRWKNTLPGSCKFVLAHNMGGEGFGFLDNIFHSKVYGPNQSPDDYDFVHFYPWDNVQWSLALLHQEGLTDYDYYNVFTEQQRMEYCARTDYGRNLVSKDAALKNRDWFGSWDSPEGAYFARAFDKKSTKITREQVAQLVKAWHPRWASSDWGKAHFSCTQWHARIDVSAETAMRVLGWQNGFTAVVTYREYIAGGTADSDSGGEREISEEDIAKEMVNRTPENERAKVRRFFLSPDAFELSVRRANQLMISDLLAKVLVKHGMPAPTKADNRRVDGWVLMYDMLLETRRHGMKNPQEQPTGGECWLISEDCPELFRAISLMMRDKKNLEDVLKTDKTSVKIEQDCADTARYGLKSMPRLVETPDEELSPDEQDAQRRMEHEQGKIMTVGDTLNAMLPY